MPAAALPTALAPLSDAARLWLFAADRPLTDADEAALLTRVNAFAEGWTSHGRPVAAVAEVLGRRVLAVGAAISEAELNAGVSGCGIDKLEHAVAAAAGGFAWAPALDVLYRDADGAVRSVPRPAFRRLAQDGAVDGATPVLDLTPTTVGALRAAGLERQAAEAWHGRVFGLGVPAESR